MGCKSTLIGIPVLIAAAGISGVAEEPVPAETELFFENQVRPILHERCVDCHGPEKQKAGLRMDSLQGALKGGDSGPALAPKNAPGSLIIRAIHYQDSDLEMPPKKKLADSEIAVLTRWIELGAPWPGGTTPDDNQPVADTATRDSIRLAAETHWSFQALEEPGVPGIDQPGTRNAIDRFVTVKLLDNGLHPSPSANRRTLIRRAYLDLIGMPPAPAEVDEFVDDSTPGSWQTLIDRLLENQHYGERWARHWMDVARYADNKGAIFAEAREYPYAYTYRDYLIRAFNDDKPYDRFIVEQIAADQLPGLEDPRDLAALGFLTLNRRIDGNKAVHEQINDRIDVVTRGFLALTVVCARCHDHKYDPVPTADYYSLYGVFDSSEEPEEQPVIHQPEPGDPLAKSYREKVKNEEAKLQEFIDLEHAKVLKGFREKAADYLMLAWDGRDKEDQPFRVMAAKRKLAPDIAVRWVTRLANAEDDPVFLPWTRFAAAAEKGLTPEQARALITGKETRLHPAMAAVLKEKNPSSMAELASCYASLFADFDKRLRDAHADTRFDQTTAADLGLNEADSILFAVIYGPEAPGVLPAGDFKKLDRPAFLTLKKKKAEMALKTALFSGAPQRAMVLIDKAEPVEPVIFLRGDSEKRGDAVPRQFLSVLSGPERKSFENGSGRLELARSIADPENPLTARAIVNRVWMHHFGQPLVKTPSDFGLRSSPPEQLALLDHLACQLIAHGWSLKWLHREIMNSATYRQSSRGNAETREIDPENRWLWHFPRRRMEIESLRDSLLAVSGKLDPTIGGPSVIVFTDGTSSQGALDDELWQTMPNRRTLYGLIDRVRLPSVMRTFDFPNPDESSAQRPATTVPLQALYLMNNDFMARAVEGVLARPEIKSATKNEARVRQLYRIILGRQPLEAELKLGLRYLDTESEKSAIAEVRDSQESPWKYGYAPYLLKEGTVDLAQFSPLPYLSGTSWQGAKEFPDKGKLGWLRLTPVGGHAGNGRFAAVRRWISPVDGTLEITGKLQHKPEEGDGVRARVFVNRDKRLAEWKVYHGETDAAISSVKVSKGDTLDFVVDQIASANYDSFDWSPEIQWKDPADNGGKGRLSWNARRDFYEVKAATASEKGEPAVSGNTKEFSPLERYTQVLLMSNEFAYIQ